MPERPTGGSPDEQPRYDWLYDGRPADEQPAADDPEPTQVLPVSGRGDSARASSADAPETSRVPRTEQTPETRRPASVAPEPGRDGGAGGERPPDAGDAGGPPPAKPRRKVRWGRIVLGVIALWLVFLIAVPIWAWSQITKVDADPAGSRPGKQPGTTYLLVGSDSRAGLSAAEKKKLSAGGTAEGSQRTDTIMLLHTGSGPSVLMSIPRDSLVDIPGQGTTKINSAFAHGGPKLLVRTIEKNTGIRVDDYVEIGFGGFVNAVDAVGGVKICPAHDLNDRRSGLHIKKGCQTVDGITALAFSRDRHSFKGLGDVQRAANQRKVVGAIGSKVKSPWTFINPFRYYNLNKAATSSIKISKGTGPVALARFALAMSSGAKSCTVPLRDLAVHWDEQRSKQLFDRLKDDKTDNLPKRLCSPSGLQK